MMRTKYEHKSDASAARYANIWQDCGSAQHVAIRVFTLCTIMSIKAMRQQRDMRIFCARSSVDRALVSGAGFAGVRFPSGILKRSYRK